MGRFALGTGAGGLLVLASAAALLVLGVVRVAPAQPDPSSKYFWFANPILMGLVVAAEEWLFRVVLVGRLAERIGPWRALAVSALVDFALHVPNGVPSVLTVLNSALFSVLVGVTYLRAGFAAAFGLHYGWNLMQWPILGFPMYGHDVARWVTMNDAGAAWLTGGRDGLESGAAGLVVLLVGTVVALVTW